MPEKKKFSWLTRPRQLETLQMEDVRSECWLANGSYALHLFHRSRGHKNWQMRSFLVTCDKFKMTITRASWTLEAAIMANATYFQKSHLPQPKPGPYPVHLPETFLTRQKTTEAKRRGQTALAGPCHRGAQSLSRECSSPGVCAQN